MDTMTSTQARRINARGIDQAAKMRTEADTLEAAGAPGDVVAEGFGITVTRAQAVATKREQADSLERASLRARAGARIGQA